MVLKNKTRAIIILALTIFYCANIQAQTLLKQTNITRMGIPYGNYSGITHVSDNLYAVVSDKDKTNSFHFFTIDINKNSGKIESVKRTEPVKAKENEEIEKSLGQKERDVEGICYNINTNTFFISGETDQKIQEYSYDGLPTGRELVVPEEFGTNKIKSNYGFEALSYNASTKLYWTTTETSLKSDYKDDTITVRLQSFGEDLNPKSQYLYRIDNPLKNKKIRLFVHGIPDILAMDDGSLIIMEREALITKKYLGSYCMIKLYKVYPNQSGKLLNKELVCQFKTSIKAGKINFANYEGICYGPKLTDGRQTILLINDSQNGQGNKLYRLKDYIKVIIL